MTQQQSRNAAYALALIVPAALMGGALISQFVFGLYPCQMCWWQRYRSEERRVGKECRL